MLSTVNNAKTYNACLPPSLPCCSVLVCGPQAMSPARCDRVSGDEEEPQGAGEGGHWSAMSLSHSTQALSCF